MAERVGVGGTLSCNPPFGIVTVLMVSAMVASWHPTGATLAERVGVGRTLSCEPAQLPPVLLMRISAPCRPNGFLCS